MKLTLEGIKDRAAWQSVGVKLPDYDLKAISEKAKARCAKRLKPIWGKQREG